jgi:hypothetical protein
VTNASTAKQPLDQFGLVLPQQAADAVIRPPENYFAIVQKERTFKLKNPDWIRSGSFAVWSFAKPEGILQPGGSKTGFELESALRPGFTVGYFRRGGNIDVKVATSGNVPKPVKDQLDTLLIMEYDSKTLLTLGPKFQASEDARTIAADFIQGIDFLVRSGALSSSSEFVRTALGELKAIQPGVPATALKLTATPRTPLETEIANALKF